jgi:hypothetical protein
MAGAFAFGLAAVPRITELTGEPARDVIVHRWRLLCGWAAGLGLAAIVISTLVRLAPLLSFGGGGTLALIVVAALVEIAIFIGVFAVPAIRVGADHPAWQPSALWLAVTFVFVLLMTAGGRSAVDSVDASFYGLWLLALAGGSCSLPLVGGRDGSPDGIGLWLLIVANAFRIILVAAGLVAVLAIVVVITAQQQNSRTPGELIWSLVAAILTAVAAAIGSSQLRAGLIRGRSAALAALAFMALITVITMAVSGMASGPGGGGADVIGLALLGGTYGIIVVGLTVPRPIREAVAAQRPPGPQPPPHDPATTQAPVATHAPPQPGARPHPAAPAQVGPDPRYSWQLLTPYQAAPDLREAADGTDGATVRSVPGGITSVTADPRRPAAPSTPPRAVGMDDDLERTIVRTPRPAGLSPVDSATAGQMYDERARDAMDPTTSLQELMTIAHTRPDLRPLVAANPATYPALLTWLGQLGDPAVDAALARREGAS